MRGTRIVLTASLVALAVVAFLLTQRGRESAPPVRIARPSDLPIAAPTSDLDATPANATTSAAETRIKAFLAGLEEAMTRRDVRKGEAVLTFANNEAMSRFLSRAGQLGLTVLARLDATRSVRVRGADFAALQGDLTANSADYADAGANFLFSVPQVPVKEDRPVLSQVPFGTEFLSFIGATGDRGTWGRGVTIAIVDTGTAPDATFGTGRLSAIDIGYGSTPGSAAEDGHGTSVAGLAAGMATDAPGVAPAASVLSVRVTDAGGTSDIFTVAQGIVAAVDAGARIVNVSLGGYGTNAALSAAIDYATSHGSVIVAAAGNDQASQLTWPAADPRVVSVGAVDKAEQQVSFSNSSPQLQLTAPGYGVQTAWLDSQRVYVDGTSASAPLVSGALAALMSQNPTLSATEAAQLLNRTATDAGRPGADASYGNGILNLAWAMNATNPAYFDPAISTHYFDVVNNRMEFVVQNRSGQAVSGLSLTVGAGTRTSTFAIPTLAAGQSDVVRVPVEAAQFGTTGQLVYSTTLTTPAGLVDQVPRNNRRASVLSAPGPR